jgi:hypothetical protein
MDSAFCQSVAAAAPQASLHADAAALVYGLHAAVPLACTGGSVLIAGGGGVVPAPVDVPVAAAHWARAAAPVISKKVRPASAHTASFSHRSASSSAAVDDALGAAAQLRDLPLSASLQRSAGLTHAFLRSRFRVARSAGVEALSARADMLTTDLAAAHEARREEAQRHADRQREAQDTVRRAGEVAAEVAGRMVAHEARGIILAQKLEEQKEECAHSVKQVERLDIALQQESASAKLVEQQLSSTADELHQIRLQHGRLQQHVEAQLRPPLSALQSERSALLERVIEAEQRCKQSDTEALLQKGKKQHWRAQVRPLELEVEQARQMALQLRAERDTWPPRFQQLEQRAALQLAESASTRAHCADLESTHTQLQEQLASTSARLAQAEREVGVREADLRRQLGEAVLAKRVAETNLASKDAQLAESQSALKQCEEHLAAERAASAALREELSSECAKSSATSASAAQETRTLGAQVTSLARELAASRSQLQSMTEAHDSVSAFKAALERRIREAEAMAEAEAREEAEMAALHARQQEVQQVFSSPRSSARNSLAGPSSSASSLPGQRQSQSSSSNSGSNSANGLQGASSPFTSRSPVKSPRASSSRLNFAHLLPSSLSPAAIAATNFPHSAGSGASSMAATVPPAPAATAVQLAVGGGEHRRTKSYALKLLLDAAHESLEIARSELAQAESVHRLDQAALEQARATAETHSARSDELALQRLGLQRQLTALQDAQGTAFAEHAQELDSLRLQLQEHQTALQESRAAHDRVEETLQRERSERTQASETVARRQTDASAVHAAALSTLRAELTAALSAHATTQVSLAAVQERSESHASSHATLAAELASLQRASAAALSDAESRALTAEQVAHNAKIASRSHMLLSAGLKLRIAQREKQIASVESALSAARAQHEAERAVLQESLHQSQSSLSLARSRAKEAADEVRQVREELHARRADIGDLKDQLSALRERQR